MVKTLEGKGFRGQRTEKELENFLLYNASLRTTEPVEFVVDGADNWLQFHYQLSGDTNTLIVEKEMIVPITSNSFAILYQKKGCCKIRFPKDCVYESFGFRVDPKYFVDSFLKDFKELVSVQQAINNDSLFFLDKKYAALDSKTREIIQEILNHPYQGSLSDVYVKHKLVELIFHSIPVLRENAEKLLEEKPAKREHIEDAKAFIAANLDQKLSLKVIAQHAGLNEYTLKREFKKEYGQSVIDFFIDLRLKRAFEDIQNTDKKITAIAYEAGYSSAGNFSNAFFKRYGFRPSELRK
ncbi:helix-turn-helix domain-containing protein [Flagellimonas algicola]|uniref:Helix-turn-helix transcriptional regulator n=1 Tax=Flagellimonas algicola TaxID=2583815 RepID=A0ABY2WJV5_9FLAO|nr:AraC family transcriptional regulator [Allomuricauda algicola]TMU54801.1 helix-turn-helix transcriptional regulator [Allomuricauda algicola]